MIRSRIAVTLVTSATVLVAVRVSPEFSAPDATARGAAENASTAVSASTAQDARPSAAEWSRIPLLFAQNAGQFEPQAKFNARYRGINAFVTDEGFRFGLIPPEITRFDPRRADVADADKSCKAANVFFTFEGASPDVRVEGERPTPTKFNYFLGSEEKGWRTDVPTFSAVRHVDIYRGVDVLLGEREGRLEYDVVVKEGGSLQDVVVRVDGAEGTQIEPDGSLTTRTAAGPLVQTPPIAFVRNKDGSTRPVPCRFVLLDAQRFGFAAEGYDGSGDLVVDPGLIYAYLMTGSVADQAYGVGGDALMNVSVGGRTASNNFPVTPGAYDVSFTAGSFDAFVAKINPNAAALTYCTFIGSSGMDYVSALHTDGAGNTYATGQAGNTSFPSTSGAYDTTYNGQGDGYVLKLNPAGNALVFSTFVGGTGEERMHAIDVDASGAAYIAGQTLSHSNYPGASTQTIPVGSSYNVGTANWNACATKVNPAGNSLGWSFRTGGNGNDWANAIAVDAAGFAYVAGGTASTTFPTANAYGATNAGGFDAFLFKVDANASAFVYATYLGSAGPDQAYGLDVDAFGQAYVGGVAGFGFPTTAGAFDVTGDGADGFVTKFSVGGGSLVWSTYLGGSSTEQVTSVRIDQGIRPVVGGWTNSNNFPTTPSGHDTTFNGGGSPAEGFLVKLTWQADALLYGSYLGGDGNDEIDALALDANGWAYVSGISYLSSPGSFIPAGTFTASVGGAGGAEEAYTAKYELPASPSVTPIGQGCKYIPPSQPGPPQVPTITSTLPTLGELLTISGTNAAPNNIGLVLVSLVPNYGVPISPECTLWFDLATVFPLAAYVSDPNGFWATAFPLFNEPSWVGAVIRMQGLALVASSPWGFELTNGIDCELGY